MPAGRPTQKERDDADVQDRIDLAVMKNTISNIDANVKAIDTKLTANYISRDEFDPIKKIVYGLIALILVAVVGAILSLIIKG